MLENRALTFVDPEANCLATRRHVKGCDGISLVYVLIFPTKAHSLLLFSSFILPCSSPPCCSTKNSEAMRIRIDQTKSTTHEVRKRFRALMTELMREESPVSLFSKLPSAVRTFGNGSYKRVDPAGL